MVSVHALTALVCLEQQQADPTAQPAWTTAAQPAGTTAAQPAGPSAQPAGAEAAEENLPLKDWKEVAKALESSEPADPHSRWDDRQSSGATAQSADPPAQPAGAEAAEENLPLKDWKEVAKALESSEPADPTAQSGLGRPHSQLTRPQSHLGRPHSQLTRPHSSVGADAAEDEALRDLLIAATESADDDLPLQDWKVKKSLSSKGGADNNVTACGKKGRCRDGRNSEGQSHPGPRTTSFS